MIRNRLAFGESSASSPPSPGMLTEGRGTHRLLSSEGLWGALCRAGGQWASTQRLTSTGTLLALGWVAEKLAGRGEAIPTPCSEGHLAVPTPGFRALLHLPWELQARLCHKLLSQPPGKWVLREPPPEHLAAGGPGKQDVPKSHPRLPRRPVKGLSGPPRCCHQGFPAS